MKVEGFRPMTQGARLVKKRPPTGFTLIELLVVICIIALVISIFIPSLSRARTEASQARTLACLRSIGQAMTLYEAENRDQHPALVDHEEKAFLGLSLLSKRFDLPPEVFINPVIEDTPAEHRDPHGRLTFADSDGAPIANETEINVQDIGRVGWHCSFAYDNDNKKAFKSALRIFRVRWRPCRLPARPNDLRGVASGRNPPLVYGPACRVPKGTVHSRAGGPEYLPP